MLRSLQEIQPDFVEEAKAPPHLVVFLINSLER
jgi:hypothetical protein